jgi:PKD repeat protein
VSLTLVDTDGDLATISHTIVVGLPPTASFTTAPAQALTGSPVSFNAGGSTDPNSGAAIAAYAWSFGDGGTALGAARSHVYAKPGVYTVTLAVADSLGFSATKSASLTVRAPGRITKLSVKKSKGKESLVISVSAAGTVRVGSRSARLRRAGNASFKLGSAPKRHHKLSVKVTVVYVPQAGPEVKVKFAKVLKG